jgi:hypothetical protein
MVASWGCVSPSLSLPCLLTCVLIFHVLLQAPPPADGGELGLRVALSVGELPEEHYQVG